MSRFLESRIKKCAAFTMLALIFAAAAASTARAEEDKVWTVNDGVYIEDTDVSGMDADELEKTVQGYVEAAQNTEVTLNVDENEVVTTAGELGYTLSNENIADEALSLGKTGNVIKRYKDTMDLKNEDVVLNIEMSIDEETAAAKVEELCADYSVEAKNATLTRTGGVFVITDEVDGVSVDSAATVETLCKYIADEWDGKSAISIDVTTEVVEAEYTSEDCALVSSTPMGTYTTYFSTGGYYKNRCLNIQNGASHLNGSVVYPGEEYSVSEHLTERNAENGYYLAGTYIDGTTQDSYGGGICQVSSTLYNALILAEINIVKRYPHSMTVSYVPLSQDAAIAGNYKDLVFSNDTDAPLYIEAIYSSGGSITFNVYGHDTRDEGRTVKFVSETTSTTAPGEKITESDEYPEGYEETVTKGHTGYTARLWKYVYENGVLVSEEIFNTSTYSATDTEKIVGTGEVEEETEENTTKKKSEETTTTKKSTETTTTKKSEETTAKSDDAEDSGEE